MDCPPQRLAISLEDIHADNSLRVDRLHQSLARWIERMNMPEQELTPQGLRYVFERIHNKIDVVQSPHVGVTPTDQVVYLNREPTGESPLRYVVGGKSLKAPQGSGGIGSRKKLLKLP